MSEQEYFNNDMNTEQAQQPLQEEIPPVGYAQPQPEQEMYYPENETARPKNKILKPLLAVLLVAVIGIMGTGVYKIWDKGRKNPSPVDPGVAADSPTLANVTLPDDYSTIYNAISKLNNSRFGNRYYMNGFYSTDSAIATNGSIPKGIDDAAAMPETESSNTSDSGKQDFSDTNVQVKGVQEADIIKTDGKYIYALNSDEKKMYTVATNNGELKVVSETELSDKFFEQIKEEAAKTPLASPTDPATSTDALDVMIDEYIARLDGTAEKSTEKGDLYKKYQDSFAELVENIDVQCREFYIYGDTAAIIAEKSSGFRPRWYYYYEYYPITNGTFNLSQNYDMLMPIHAYALKTETIVLFYDFSDKTNPVFKNSISMSGRYISSRMVENYLYFVTSESIYSNMINEKVPETYVPTLRSGADVAVEPIKDICILDDMTHSIYTNVCGVDASSFGTIISSKSLLGGGEDIYSNTENLYVYCTVYNYDKVAELLGVDDINDIDADDVDPDDIDFGEEYYEFEQTQITKFSFKDGKIELYADNAVNGRVINQFALDEYNGYLRVVVTNEGEYMGDDEDKDYFEEWNTLVIFDSNMKQISSIEKISVGEELKSVRFDGDIGYFVTFVQTDPLFTVDLKDPYDPKILSELKIPGFSTYLHPYGDSLLFGLGNAADEETGITEGLKLSMFDVSNKADVTEQNTLIFAEDTNDENTYVSYYSMALYNHKAILVSPEKNIIGVPVSYEISKYNENYESNSKLSYMFFKYSEQDGFVQIGEAVVVESNDYTDWDNYYSIYRDSVRGMYIGDYLYVVSTAGCTSFTLSDFTKVASVEFAK